MKGFFRVLPVVFFLGLLNTLAQPSERPHVEKIAPGEIRAPEPFAMGNLLDAVEPVYPDDAKAQHIAGKVMVKVLINKEGKVEEASPLDGDPLLSAATVAAVKQWKFRPYIFNSEPVIVQTTVTAVFALDPTAVNVPKPRLGPLKLRVSQGVAEKNLLRKVDPSYPLEAKQNGIQGDVTLRATIDKNGDVTDLRVESGDPLLAAAALEAVRRWKYRPYLLNGQSVDVETLVRITFRLGR
jgi:TonB family protein